MNGFCHPGGEYLRHNNRHDTHTRIQLWMTNQHIMIRLSFQLIESCCNYCEVQKQYISQPLLAQKITKKFLTRSFISVSYHITQNCPFSFSNIFCMHDSWSTSNKFVAQITNVKQNTKLNSFIFLLCSWSIVVHMEHKVAKVGVEWNWDEVAHRYWNQTFGRIPVVHVRTDPVGMRSIGGNSRRENEDVFVCGLHRNWPRFMM